MKVAVFGATGPLGFEVLKEAAARQHDVVAVVRNTDKLKQLLSNSSIPDGRVNGAKADVFNSESVQSVLEGVEAVINCLGVGKLRDNPKSYLVECRLYSDTLKAIADGMRANSVKRIICLTGWFIDTVPGMPIMYRFARPFISLPIKDVKRMEDHLAQLAKEGVVDYTVVRPGYLTMEESCGKPLLALAKSMWVQGASDKIPRVDVAKFMIDCMEKGSYMNEDVAIAVPGSVPPEHQGGAPTQN